MVVKLNDGRSRDGALNRQHSMKELIAFAGNGFTLMVKFLITPLLAIEDERLIIEMQADGNIRKGKVNQFMLKYFLK